MTTLPGTHESYWMDSVPPTPHPALDGDVEVDVAVVGGGIAGICTAWELARAGRSVAILEADRVAAGTTGYTTAKLSALHGLVYSQLARAHGAEGARLYARSQQDAVEHVAEVADELGADCDLERVPAYSYVESADGVDQIRAEADAAREAGLPASFTTDTGLPFDVAGAARVTGQAQFHPRKYLTALVADLLDHGGSVYERTRVLDLDEGDPCRLTTENGATVTARDVVVATHYPVFDRALLFSRLEPRRELVVAAPLPADRAPGGAYLTTEQNTRSVRTTPYGDGRRLLIVTGETFKPGTGDTEEMYLRLAEWTRERFDVTEITHRWAAQDNHTTDRVPYVGLFHPGTEHVWVATGYGAWGMSNGVMSGRLLAALITGGASPWAELYDPRRLRGLREAPAFFRLQASVARHFIGDRLTTTHVDSVEEIPPGSGAVVRVNGQRCAVYRDGSGTAHAVSARCTHLGCIVAFNAAEEAWECPCHGSRFGLDGEVLHGPATHPLDRVDVSRE
ncbi:FAD-dependent oxidoreductase [Thermobifida halotolerans]|uniref:FAD-dependent oxidoreductase n=1 Tax=Thermobifida halotolerans TaxID=483545 RepID=UPI0008385E85|nr:FAD-dependent oxidoreductase [Thermobifida halotolerans]